MPHRNCKPFVKNKAKETEIQKQLHKIISQAKKKIL